MALTIGTIGARGASGVRKQRCGASDAAEGIVTHDTREEGMQVGLQLSRGERGRGGGSRASGPGSRS